MERTTEQNGMEESELDIVLDTQRLYDSMRAAAPDTACEKCDSLARSKAGLLATMYSTGRGGVERGRYMETYAEYVGGMVCVHAVDTVAVVQPA